MAIRRWGFWLLIGLLTVLLAHPAEAHRPVWGTGEVIELPNLTTSFAAYRELATPEQVDVFGFSARAGERLTGGINIPAIDGLQSYRVRVALFGPGLPDAPEAQLPPEHPGGGALIFDSAASPDFFEPFTQTNYWGRQELDVSLPVSGEYWLLVWNPDGEPGKYVLDTGSEEVFAPGDMLRFPIWWVQVHLFFEHGPYLFAGGLLVLAVAGWLVWRRVRA